MTTYHHADYIVLSEQSAQPGSTAAGKGYLWAKNDAPSILKFTDDTGADFSVGAATSSSTDVETIGHTYCNGALSIGASSANSVQVIGQYDVKYIKPKSNYVPTSGIELNLFMYAYQGNFSNEATHDTTNLTPMKLTSGATWVIPKAVSNTSSNVNIGKMVQYGHWIQTLKTETYFDLSDCKSSTVCNLTSMDVSSSNNFIQQILITSNHHYAVCEVLGAGGWGAQAGDGGYARTTIALSGFVGKYLYSVRGLANNSNTLPSPPHTFLRGGDTYDGDYFTFNNPYFGPGGGASFVTIGDADTFWNSYHTFICIGGGGGGVTIELSDPYSGVGGSGNCNPVNGGVSSNPDAKLGKGSGGGFAFADGSEYFDFGTGGCHGVAGINVANTANSNAVNLNIQEPILGSSLSANSNGMGASDKFGGGGGYGGGGVYDRGGGGGGSFGTILRDRNASGIVTLFTNQGYTTNVGLGCKNYNATYTTHPDNHGGAIITLYGDW